jgi:tellurium resistance protein TerZ
MALSLAKNQSLSLKKDDGSNLTKVRLGLGWDAVQKKAGFFSRATATDIDLDASVILLDANKNVVDTVWFQKKVSNDGSIHHSGDNTTGTGDGDDETIKIDLVTVSSNVETIVCVVTSYAGQTFDQVDNVFARVLDDSAGRGTEVVRYDLSDTGNKTGSVIAKLTRSHGSWAFTALGTPANGKAAPDLIAAAQAAA